MTPGDLPPYEWYNQTSISFKYIKIDTGLHNAAGVLFWIMLGLLTFHPLCKDYQFSCKPEADLQVLIVLDPPLFTRNLYPQLPSRRFVVDFIPEYI